MRSRQLRLLTIALLCSLMPRAHATSGAISVAVKIIDNTCTLATTDTLVALDGISTERVKQGVDIGKKNFAVTLTDCGADATKVRIAVSGEPDTIDKTAFKNTSTIKSAASGVGLHVYIQNGAQTTLMNPSDSTQDVQQLLLPNGDNSIHFQAGYAGTGAMVNAGDFSTLLHLTLEYQ
ncbi:fimbrial protein [Xanthomonas axonopodis]|uniref:fimbrial protein n=1 Tax=Xanthomonas axonopodis TaxID=53413 RepID=UPI0035560E6A